MELKNIFDELFINYLYSPEYIKCQIIDKYINNINDKNNIGRSVLHEACSRIHQNNIEIVKLF